MRIIDWISKKLKIFEETSILIFVVIILIILLFNIALRYFFNYSLTWGEELSRFLFIGATYIGASAGIRTKGHIIVDIIFRLFPRSNKSINIFSSLLASLFSLLIFFSSFRVICFLKNLGQISTGLLIPMWIPYILVLFGSIMMAFRFIEICLKSVIEK